MVVPATFEVTLHQPLAFTVLVLSAHVLPFHCANAGSQALNEDPCREVIIKSAAHVPESLE